jgi:DNA-binding response OmpR family regulator
MKILICEDDLVSLKAMQIALDKEAVELTCVSDGSQAMDKIRNQEFDLIVTDIHMPYHNGDEILQLVRQEKKLKTPIVMISSDAEEEVIDLALKQGVDIFLKKPILPREFLKRIQKFIK